MLNKLLLSATDSSKYRFQTSFTIGKQGTAYGYVNDEDYSFGKLEPSFGITGLAVNSSRFSYCITFAGGYTPSAIVVVEVLANEWDSRVEELYFPSVDASFTKENVYDLLEILEPNVNSTLSLYIKFSENSFIE